MTPLPRCPGRRGKLPAVELLRRQGEAHRHQHQREQALQGRAAEALRQQVAAEHAVGAAVGRFVPEGVLIVAFCLLVLWSAWRMWRGAGMKREASDQARSLPLLGIGLAVGLLSGLMGVGGGFLVVPGLLWFTPLSMMAATATSMAVIALVSGGGFLIYLTGAHPPLPLLGGLAAGGAVGVLGGNLLAQRLGGPTLQRLFALMLVAVSFSLAAQKLYGG